MLSICMKEFKTTYTTRFVLNVNNVITELSIYVIFKCMYVGMCLSRVTMSKLDRPIGEIISFVDGRGFESRPGLSP